MITVKKDNVERIIHEDDYEKFKEKGFKKINVKVVTEVNDVTEDIQKPLDIDAMKIEELKALAKEKGITGYSSLNKEELIAVLKQNG